MFWQVATDEAFSAVHLVLVGRSADATAMVADDLLERRPLEVIAGAHYVTQL